ncbi:hypothetical protein [Bradyrhizobium sp. 2TAF24]|uniref:hypothetical protein n=1 Tax=Bradyrhizobium sp. 2TAF24 TaxID=3233011 RepID=UPI003F901EDE
MRADPDRGRARDAAYVVAELAAQAICPRSRWLAIASVVDITPAIGLRRAL